MEREQQLTQQAEAKSDRKFRNGTSQFVDVEVEVLQLSHPGELGWNSSRESIVVCLESKQ